MIAKRKQRKLAASNFVYLAGEHNGLHKIGHSCDPDARIIELGQFDPPIKLIAKIKTIFPASAERWLHTVFADKREKREWFRLSQEDVAAFSAMVALDRLKDLPPGLLSRYKQFSYRMLGRWTDWGPYKPSDIPRKNVVFTCNLSVSDAAIVTEAMDLTGESRLQFTSRVLLAAARQVIEEHSAVG